MLSRRKFLTFLAVSPIAVRMAIDKELGLSSAYDFRFGNPMEAIGPWLTGAFPILYGSPRHAVSVRNIDVNGQTIFPAYADDGGIDGVYYLGLSRETYPGRLRIPAASALADPIPSSVPPR